MQGSRHRVGVLPSSDFRRLQRYYDPVRLLARPRRLDYRLVRRVAVAPPPTRSPVFNAFLLRRAVPATPESASVHRLSTFPRRVASARLRGARPPRFRHGATSGFAARYGPSRRSRWLAPQRHSGPASAGRLTTSRRGPRYPTAQRFIGVGSFHPTRNAPLSRRTVICGWLFTACRSRRARNTTPRRSWPTRESSGSRPTRCDRRHPSEPQTGDASNRRR